MHGSRSNFSDEWIRATAAAGAPGFRFHDLRRPGATIAAQTGATHAVDRLSVTYLAQEPRTYIKAWGSLPLPRWSIAVGTYGLEPPTSALQGDRNQ